MLPSYFPFGLAGEEGFEPPHPVLETGGLPLNLLPFTLSSRVSGREGFIPFASLHLAMDGVFPARITEFLRLHPVGVLFLVFCRRIVPVLAIIALQRDDFAHQAAP
jgi:hypothetical protein